MGGGIKHEGAEAMILTAHLLDSQLLCKCGHKCCEHSYGGCNVDGCDCDGFVDESNPDSAGPGSDFRDSVNHDSAEPS